MCWLCVLCVCRMYVTSRGWQWDMSWAGASVLSCLGSLTGKPHTTLDAAGWLPLQPWWEDNKQSMLTAARYTHGTPWECQWSPSNFDNVHVSVLQGICGGTNPREHPGKNAKFPPVGTLSKRLPSCSFFIVDVWSTVSTWTSWFLFAVCAGPFKIAELVPAWF